MAHSISREVIHIVALIRLEVSHYVRRPRYLAFGVGIPIAIYFAYLVAGIGGPTDQRTGGVAWPGYLMVSMAAFGAMNAAAGVAAGTWRETSGTSRPGAVRAVGRLAAAPNVGVRAASAMVLVLPPVILVGLAAGLDGLRQPGVDWLILTTSLWLGAVPFVALGLLIGPMLDADTRDVVL